DAVTHADHLRPTIALTEPPRQDPDGPVDVPYGVLQGPVRQADASLALRGELGGTADPVDLALRIDVPALHIVPLEDTELEARGAGVENERIDVHGSPLLHPLRMSAPAADAARAPRAPRPRSSRCAISGCPRGSSG